MVKTGFFKTFFLYMGLLFTMPDVAETVSYGTEYIFVKNKFTWEEAYQACATLGAGLARVDSYYVQYQLTAFKNDEWNGVWDSAWFGLHWTTATTPQTKPRKLWTDNCAELHEEWYTNFKDVKDTSYKTTERCYILADVGMVWTRLSCNSIHNVLCEKPANYTTAVELYEQVDINFVPIDTAHSSPADCKELCDQVYGCYVTSYHGDHPCILGLVTPEADTYIKVNRSFGREGLGILTWAVVNWASNTSSPERWTVAYINLDGYLKAAFELRTAGIHTFTSEEETSIKNSVTAKQTLSLDACPVSPNNNNNNTVPGPYIDVASLQPLDCPTVQTETATTKSTVPVSSNTYDITPSSSDVTPVNYYATPTIHDVAPSSYDVTPSSSDVISASDSFTPYCIPSAASFNLSLEETHAIVQSIVKELSINVKATSKALAKFSSADDSRTSAQAMGYVSIVFICLVLFLILAIDAPTFYFGFRARLKAGNWLQ